MENEAKKEKKGWFDKLREARARMESTKGNTKQLADIERSSRTMNEQKQDKVNKDVANSGVTNVKVEAQKVEQSKPSLPAATHKNIARAKEGDKFVRSNGEEITVTQGDIDYSNRKVMETVADFTKQPEIEQTTGPAITSGDTEAIGQAVEQLEDQVTAEGENGTRLPLDENTFNSNWSISSNNGKSEMVGNLNVDQMSNTTQQVLNQNPYNNQPLAKDKWLEQNPGYQKDNDFAKKLTYFSAFASLFSGGKIPFVDFRELSDANQAYQLYLDTINKSNEFQSSVLQNETSNLQNTRYGLANTVIGAEAQGSQALKQIDAQAEADLRRIHAEGMNMLDQIKEQGTVQEKLTRLASVLQTQQLGDLMDDMRSRGYTDKDIAHFIMAKNMGISPGQQIYENVMKGINAGGDIVSSILSIIP